MIDWLGILNVIIDCDVLLVLLIWYEKDRRRQTVFFEEFQIYRHPPPRVQSSKRI